LIIQESSQDERKAGRGESKRQDDATTHTAYASRWASPRVMRTLENSD
jgi:hypothetical protein